ncbi:MAG: anaerobic nitric oxide reductase flavorubredoxin [Candidatus Mcinerneyibacterium aminivorans]|uniref:Anaerobic nitric oxide reductase flavorubredoxin n=1 Tax=Candidatus Mcinerneyibacterium aminivorans TaxID=2703815 RepID=A0A5D0MFN6_9BACT|nr:MAG: anaerobic nitric oxide reductase flavorubredoxin [Candidatus Mcinerneyibacterium aminivorans]
MDVNLTESVKWVGKVDWDLKSFHGDEYSTHRGSTYNSYLIRDEKNVLIDTVWAPFSKEFVKKLKKEIDLKKIDYIVANHAEIDHSGGLVDLMKEIPETPIYCTQNAVDSLTGHYHMDWNFQTIKTGDELDIGNKKLIFIEAPMLHWPDSMFCYLTGDNILFSNDAFGQHYATELLYNDKVDQCELFQEAIKYYANILTPFSKLVKKKIEEVLSFELPVDFIAPSHGVIWRDNPTQIVDKYLEWADNYKENQITFIYDSMWNSTKKIAESIKDGIYKKDPGLDIKMMKASRWDKNDIITEVFKSKAIFVGSPTINKGILSSIAGLLEEIRGLGFKEKSAASFGSYGWSGESKKMINHKLEEAGFKLIDEGILIKWNPNNSDKTELIDYGKKISTKL